MRIEFEGMRALVTGSTRGIGQAIASSLAASGANVWCTDESMRTPSAWRRNFKHATRK